MRGSRLCHERIRNMTGKHEDQTYHGRVRRKVIAYEIIGLTCENGGDVVDDRLDDGWDG